jgi:hypothetical protein
MADPGDSTPDTFDQITREQLEIYAREVQIHYNEERRLRRQLEERNEALEQRIREITALNELFQRHLAERDSLVDSCLRIGDELQALAERAGAEAPPTRGSAF